MNAIRTVQLKKTYGHYHVLQDVSLEVAEGECFALFGANGSGKTTLLRILATLNRPTAGHFEILGRDGVQHRDAIRAEVLLLAHGSHLYDDLNAVENLEFSLALRDQRPSAADLKRALDQVGLGAFADMRSRYFSAGMKKRLGIAKSLLSRPKILLLDEPFTALDESGTQIMKQCIQDTMGRGGAVLLSTHDRDKIADLATRAGTIAGGILHPVTL